MNDGFYYLEPYSLKLDLSWMSKEANENLKAFEFKYTLTQYTPSVSAEIRCFLDEKYIKEFEKIYKMDVDTRKVTVQALPSLKREGAEKEMFSGPWNFVAVKQEITQRNLRHDMAGYGATADQIHKENAVYYHIKLFCMDKNYITLNGDEITESFKEKKISEVVEKIFSDKGIDAEIIPTKETYNWIVSNEKPTDYIKTLLPYSVSENDENGYLCYSYNEKTYFKPVDQTEDNTMIISLESLHPNGETQSIDNNELIEQYGDIENFTIADHGFNNFEEDKPDKIKYQAHNGSGKQKKGKYKKKINITVDKKEFKKFFASNIRKRIYMCSRIIKTQIRLNTDITPFTIIEVQNTNTDKKETVQAGFYYVLAVQHRISMQSSFPFTPGTFLVLGTDVDIEGQESPEGDSILKSGFNLPIILNGGKRLPNYSGGGFGGNSRNIPGYNSVTNPNSPTKDQPYRYAVPVNTSIITDQKDYKRNYENSHYNEVIKDTNGETIGRFTGSTDNEGHMEGTMYNPKFEPYRKYDKTPSGDYIYYDKNTDTWHEQRTDREIVRPGGTVIPFQPFPDDYKGPDDIVYVDDLTREEQEQYHNSGNYDVPDRYTNKGNKQQDLKDTINYTVNDIINNLEDMGLTKDENGKIDGSNMDKNHPIVDSLGESVIEELIDIWNDEADKVEDSFGKITYLLTVFKGALKNGKIDYGSIGA